MKRIDRRKRSRGTSWSRAALVGCALLSNLGPVAARTWEVLVQPAVFVLLDHDMIRQIPESDPVFTQTQLGTDPPTQMPVPTPSPVPQPTSAPSSSPSARPTMTPRPTITPAPVTPTISPRPTVYVSYPPGEGPTMAPTPIYRNENIDSLCPQSEKAHEIHMQDIFGDGWEGRNLTITVAESPHIISKVTETQIGNSTVIKYKTTTVSGEDVYYYAGNKVWTGTLRGAPNGPGDADYSYMCIRPGVCYEAYMPGGAWAEEILWEVKEPTFNVTPADNYAGVVIAKGGAPARCLFSIPDPVTQMTFCPTTCNRFPLDPTPYPSGAPTTSAFPSGAPSSNFPSAMLSLEPSTLYAPSAVPSTFPSSEPSEGPSESPTLSGAPSPPADTPTVPPTTLVPSPPTFVPTPANIPTNSFPSFVPTSANMPTNSSPSLVPTSANMPTNSSPPPSLVPTPANIPNSPPTLVPTPANIPNSPPTLVDISHPNTQADAVTGPSPTAQVRRRRRRQPTAAAPQPTLLVDVDHSQQYSDMDTMTSAPVPPPTRGPTTSGLPPTQAVTNSDGVAYNRPYVHNYGGGGNVATRQNGNGGGGGGGNGQGVRYRNNGQQQRFRNNRQQQRFRNNGNNANVRTPTAAPPTQAPPTVKKEVLDITHLGNGVR